MIAMTTCLSIRPSLFKCRSLAVFRKKTLASARIGVDRRAARLFIDAILKHAM
jgi:hypothetical protein